MIKQHSLSNFRRNDSARVFKFKKEVARYKILLNMRAKHAIIFTFAAILITVVYALNASAIITEPESDWTTSRVKVTRDSNLSTNPDAYGLYGSCVIKAVQLPNSWGVYQDTEACVFQAKSFEYTITTDGILFIRMNENLLMYPVRNVGFYSQRYVLPSPSTDDIIFAHTVIRDVPNKIVLSAEGLLPHYEPKQDFIEDLSVDNEGTRHPTLGQAVSRNGRWLVVNFRDIGFVRFDLMNKQAAWLAPNRGIAEFMAVSNDGMHLAMAAFSSMNPPMVYNLRICGHAADGLSADWTSPNLPNQCHQRDLSPEINDALGSSWFTSNAKPDFSDDGLALTLFVRPNNSGGEGIILNVESVFSDTALDYLALGDSYSSGEGDTAKQANGLSFYTPQTAAEGGCHLSSRSYPFVIKRLTSISDNRMQSVACSGAQVTKDYHGSGATYLGQGDRLKGKSESQLQNERTAALNEFTPGLLKQVDFVRANRPKVITLTGGGNDVGFGKIMSYCAHFVHQNRLTGTCDYAKKGSKLHGVLANSIKAQYRNTGELITSVKEASPHTTIYVIGYPSFVASRFGCVNDGSLNQSEVDMLNSSITYMNDVIKHAAQSNGAKYIDIEGSLNGGRICEGGNYMTGPAAMLSSAQIQEFFHPNASGNERLAQSIVAAGFSLDADSNPAPDATVTEPIAHQYFSGAANTRAEQKEITPQTKVKRGQKIQISIPAASFHPGVSVSVTLYSNPTKLGTYNVEADGSLVKDVTIPVVVEPGYHVLLVESQSSDGTPIALYQFLEVTSPNVDDTDGDGIANGKDPCLYITHWYDETTKKDICKVASSHSWPGQGNGSNSGQHDHDKKHRHITKAIAHYRRIVTHYHAWLGVVICFGVLGFRIR